LLRSYKNAATFRKQLIPFVEHARKAGRGRRRRSARTSSSRERSGDIRAWAKDKGIAISERGRIPASVVEQYEAAT
jgi:Lsr2